MEDEKHNKSTKMKKLIFLAFAIIAAIACVGFASCSDDDKDEPQKTEDLIGSVWEGINPHTDYFTKVEIKNDSKCAVTVYPSNSPANSYSEVCTYVYDSSTGNFNVKFDGYNITGFIKGDTMTLTDSGNGSYDLKRVK